MEKLTLLLCCVTIGSSLRTSHREYSFFHVIKDGETTFRIPEAQGVIKLSQLPLARRINRIITCFRVFKEVRNILWHFNDTESVHDNETWAILHKAMHNSNWDVIAKQEESLRTHLKSYDYPEFNTFLIQDTKEREQQFIKWENEFRSSIYPLQIVYENTLQLYLANQIDHLRREVWLTSKTEWDFIYGEKDNEMPAEWILHLWRLQTAYSEMIRTSLSFELQDHTTNLVNHLMTQLSNFISYMEEIHTTLKLTSNIIAAKNMNNTFILDPQTTKIINHRFGFEHGDVIQANITTKDNNKLEVQLSVYKYERLQLRQLVPKFDMEYFTNSVRIKNKSQEYFAVQQGTVFAIKEDIYHQARLTDKINKKDLIEIPQDKCQTKLLLTGYETHCTIFKFEALKGRKECREDFCLLSNANCPKNINYLWNEEESVCTITSANAPFQLSIIDSSEDSYDHNVDERRAGYMDY